METIHVLIHTLLCVCGGGGGGRGRDIGKKLRHMKKNEESRSAVAIIELKHIHVLPAFASAYRGDLTRRDDTTAPDFRSN